MLYITPFYNDLRDKTLQLLANKGISLQTNGDLLMKLLITILISSLTWASSDSDCIKHLTTQTQKWYEDNTHLDSYFSMFSEWSSKSLERDMQTFVDYLPEVKNPHVHDIAMGTGRDVAKFKEMGLKVSMNELSVPMANKARQFLKEQKGIKGLRISHYKFTDYANPDLKNKFHGVWAQAALVNIHLDEFEQNLAAILSSIKKGGILHMSILEGMPLSRSFQWPQDNYSRIMTQIDISELSKILDVINWQYGISTRILSLRVWPGERPVPDWVSFVIKKTN